MNQNWARLGEALQAARRQRRLSQQQLGEMVGVKRSAIQNIERGVGFKKITPTIRAYARVVGWTDTSIDSVLAGGDPTVADRDTTPHAPEPAARNIEGAELPLRIVRELEDGPLLDSTVIPLSAEGEGRMVIVVRGKADADPDQIRRALEAWERREVQLRSMDDPQRSQAAEEA